MTLLILSNNSFLIQRIEEGLAVHCPSIKVIGHCYSVEAGMEAIDALKPNVVLLDIGMPRVKKQDVLTMLTSGGYRVVALTSDETLYWKLFKNGFDVAISEPLDIASFVSMIRLSG